MPIWEADKGYEITINLLPKMAKKALKKERFFFFEREIYNQISYQNEIVI